jgi:hypothetical protein
LIDSIIYTKNYGFGLAFREMSIQTSNVIVMLGHAILSLNYSNPFFFLSIFCLFVSYHIYSHVAHPFAGGAKGLLVQAKFAGFECHIIYSKLTTI